ncbi:MAG: fumarylacetoacetate hydrolase family protein [Nitrospirota bacterium]|nr:fumarylacetoacetate hydrolase family protein [Nitrospirota bacterium]
MNSPFPSGLVAGDRLVRYLRPDGSIQWGLLLSGGDVRSVGGTMERKEDLVWLPPVLPGKIVAVGLNDRGHALEMGKALPDEPLLFLKSISSIGAHMNPVPYPAVSSRVDFEGEIALVIGKRADHVGPSDARQFLYGITAANDMTARDLQMRDVQYTRAKSFTGFCPLGPAILVGEVPDGRYVRTRVNGDLRQDGRETDQIFRWESLLSYISHMMPLEPGDVVLTGTYRGVGPLAVGDKVEVEVEGLPPLISRIVPDPYPALYHVWKKSGPDA